MSTRPLIRAVDASLQYSYSTPAIKLFRAILALFFHISEVQIDNVHPHGLHDGKFASRGLA